MKRFYIVAVALVLTACLGNNAWSQGGQGGGAGTSGAAGGAGTAGAAGASGPAGTAGTAGSAGTSGTAGTPGSGIGTANNPGVSAGVGVGANPNGFGANANVNGQTRPGANAQLNAAQRNVNQNGFSESPFFADPGARQQLGLNRAQYNQLNRAHQQALQNYNRDLSGLNNGTTNNLNNPNAANNLNSPNNLNAQPETAVTHRAQRQRELQAQRQQGLSQQAQRARNQQANANGNVSGTAATDAAVRRQQQEQALRMQELQNRYATEFNGTVDSTFTDPAMRQRFNQLNWQYQGVGAFNDPIVQQQLNLTPQQRQQFQTMSAEWRQQLLELQRNTRSNLTQQQFNELRAQFMNQLNTVLTPDQQQQWTQLVGQPYEFPYTSYVSPTNTTTANQGQLGVQQQQGTDGQTIVPKNSARSGATQGTPSTRTR